MRAFQEEQDISINTLRRGDCNCHDDACSYECGEININPSRSQGHRTQHMEIVPWGRGENAATSLIAMTGALEAIGGGRGVRNRLAALSTN